MGAERRRGVNQLEISGHPEVCEERPRGVEIEQQVFTPSPRLQKPASGRLPREPFDVERTTHGNRFTVYSHDSESGNLESERTSYGFDFGKLGHDLGLESGVAQTVESGHHLVRAWGGEIAVGPPAEPLPVTHS